MDPESSTLSDGGKLSRLEVSPSEGGKILVLFSEFAETFDDDGEFWEDDIASVSEEDEIGVVGNVAGGSSQMDDSGGCGSVKTEDMDVSHDIMTTLLLFESSFCHLLVVEILCESGRERRRGAV